MSSQAAPVGSGLPGGWCKARKGTRMKEHTGLIWVGAIVALGLGSWIACDNGGPSTVPRPPGAAPASLEVDGPSTTLARVTETAAQDPPLLPWHDCLNDVGGVWQVDDGRRCTPIQSLHIETGWSRSCGLNQWYFPNPDWQCCVDDGTGQCVPGTQQSESSPPQETEPEGPSGARVWIRGTSPANGVELCEGDFIHVVGLRRSRAEGELRGSLHLVDPELEAMIDLADNPDTPPHVPIEGRFRLADGEVSIDTYVLDQQRIGRCPDCSEQRNVVLEIRDLIYTVPAGTERYRIGDPVVFQVRKATDDLCQPM